MDNHTSPFRYDFAGMTADPLFREPAGITDATEVRVLDLTPRTGTTADIDNGVEPVELWRGRLADFEIANEMTGADASVMRLELASQGHHIIGGGAASPYRVEVC